MQQKSDNDFDFIATTDKDITINVESYVSASGTYTLRNVQDTISVSVGSTSTFGGHIWASAAETISITGGGQIRATISGRDTKTINVDVALGRLLSGQRLQKPLI